MYSCINMHALFNFINREKFKNLANSTSKFEANIPHV